MIKRSLQTKRLGIPAILLILGIFVNGSVFAVEQSIAAAEILHIQLENAVKSRDTAQANQLSGQIVQAWPGTSHAMDARAEMGYFSALKKNDADAQTILAELYSQHSNKPTITRAVERVAKGYLPKRDPAKAHAILTEALTKLSGHPDIVWIHAGIIKCQIIQGDLTQAEAGLEQLWSQYSSAEGFVESVNAVKYAYRISRDRPAVQTLCDRIVTNYPNHPLIPLILRDEAKACVQLNDLSRAEAKTEELFTKHNQTPGFVDLVLPICELFARKNNPALALQYLNRALQFYPERRGDVSILKAKAHCYVDMGDGAQADAMVDEIIQSHSTKKEFAQILNGLASRYRKQGWYATSSDLYQRAIGNNLNADKQLRAHTAIGKNSVWADDHVRAKSKVDLIVANYKDHPKAGYSVFVIGEEYYKKAMQSNGRMSTNAIRNSYIKAVLIWQKNLSEIQDPFHRCLAYYYTGSCYQNLGNYRMSLASYHKVLNKYPDSEYAGNALLMIGRIYQKIQRDDIDINLPTVSMSVSDPNDLAVVDFSQLFETIDPNSVTTTSIEADAMSITSTKEAFELLLEKYSDNLAANYASQWLSKNSSN